MEAAMLTGHFYSNLKPDNNFTMQLKNNNEVISKKLENRNEKLILHRDCCKCM